MRWSAPVGPSTVWAGRWKIGRVTVGYFAYRHVYPTSEDRWVFRPELIYDRKPQPPGTSAAA